MKNNRLAITLVMILTIGEGCRDRETKIDKNKMLGIDYRLFQDTPAWSLAKATEDQDTIAIQDIAMHNKELVDFRDPLFKKTLLQFAILTGKYFSVKALLISGANPNVRDNIDGKSALLYAITPVTYNAIATNKYLKLLLKYGADPNLSQDTSVSSNVTTPLLLSCSTGNLEFIKVLIAAGAEINYKSKLGGTALASAMISRDPDVVLYLIKSGADYRQPTLIDSKGQKRYITYSLRSWRFDLNSEKYKKKMQIVDFLYKHGMSYRQEPIPGYFHNLYDSNYLSRY